MKTKLFTLLLAVAASVGTMFAWDYERVQIGDLYYNLDATNQTAEVTYRNYTNYEYNQGWGITTANIPTTVTYSDVAYSVTSIGDHAFAECTGLTSVTIPNSVTSIGTEAFRFCTGLTSVTIPNSVTSIGDNAFYGCSGLTSIEIPNSVTSIGGSAFSRCSSLTSVTIPNSVTSIGREAFSGCSGLTSIEIPNSVTSIGDQAFQSCTGLTSIEIPNSVTSIGNEAFQSCSGLTLIEIPNSVTSIGNRAFSYCSGLTSLKLSASLEPMNPFIAGFYEYYPTRSSYQQGYEWLKNLISIEAPAWFFDVPETDWIYCPRHLQHVAVNNGELTESALNAINQSYKTLQTLDVSNVTNTEFADEAFKGYYNLTELKLPAGLQKVGYMMVAGCKNLQSIDIPASVEEIEQSAFEDCRSIKTITFGGSSAGAPGRFNAPAASTSLLRRIGNWAFYNAHELQNLEIPEGVTEIGDGAFYGCTYLEEMVLPSSVQEIGDNTFALCSKLKKITVNSLTPPTIQAKTFYDVKRQIPVYVPDESVDEYEGDTYWQEFNIQGISNMPQGLEDVSSSLQGGDRGRLILHDGQIYILRGDKTYTLTGAEVK
ncbi:MAG: leucine-rich repeat domain-containing protein [Paludibacteraceae bacterium]|nr:leucine-rich repeat domain-containing protein [Paludibacteraceae bacterium]